MQDELTGCIGCGCLSLKTCNLLNPGDELRPGGTRRQTSLKLLSVTLFRVAATEHSTDHHDARFAMGCEKHSLMFWVVITSSARPLAVTTPSLIRRASCGGARNLFDVMRHEDAGK